MARGRALSYTKLSEYLWGWTPPATMSAQIYSYVYKLRKQLGDEVRLERQHAGYTLDTLGADFDAVIFDRRVEQGRRALAVRDYGSAAEQLRGALALWRGPAMANVTEHLAEIERPPLEEAWANATEQRIEADLALRQDTGLVPELTSLVGKFPLREQFRAQLVLALCRSGRRADALLAFHEGRRVLADQLGVDPGPMLVRAYQEALHDEEPEYAPEPSVVARERRRRATSSLLPPDISHFTGRLAELATVRGAWAAAGGPWVRTAPSRLLITGAVGTGKTALAVRIGHTSAEQFPDGVLYAALSEWDGTPRPVADVLAQLLHGMGQEPAPGADVHDLLRDYRAAGHDRRVLVILDDVVDERWLDDLIPASPLAAAVVTSRQYLTGFPHRHVLALDPLPERDGVKLLAAIAGEYRVYKEMAAARTVVRLCDGLPLALHIAGARLASHPLWTVEHLATRLADPARRLDELCHARQTVRGRLMAAMQRLPAPARALLPALVSADHAGFTARSVTSAATALVETADRLEELADLHLVAPAAVDDAGFTRFRLTGLNRLLAAELAARAAHT
ncbi:BTAD domain-containing putative transcriptional regulator [Actinoplanes sp. NPDC020271]|uniref:AfsR/SARP family transcriptional regulator n=1 Tax=Actinoplanes sp. NPDC020271 TaxID=3363896 RepID=UPI0037A2C2FF